MNNEEYFQHLFSGLPGSLVGGAKGAIALGTTLSNCGNNEAAARMFEAAEWAEANPEKVRTVYGDYAYCTASQNSEGVSHRVFCGDQHITDVLIGEDPQEVIRDLEENPYKEY
jgi:hypothetical protein